LKKKKGKYLKSERQNYKKLEAMSNLNFVVLKIRQLYRLEFVVEYILVFTISRTLTELIKPPFVTSGTLVSVDISVSVYNLN
jgi:hypothetical protein